MSKSVGIKRSLFVVVARLLVAVERGIFALTRILRTAQSLNFRRLYHTSWPGDLFIVSYPKAGTTAMQLIVHHVLGRGYSDFRHIDDVVPWFEAKFRDAPEYYEGLRRPRAFKTHLPFAKLPRDVDIIYLIRNPKDACISYYFHLTSKWRRDATARRICKQFCRWNGRGGIMV